jgi:hypothetical protein
MRRRRERVGVGFVETVALGAAFLVIAALYACVGQAGAFGYLAAIGLAGLDPRIMKPTALALNVLVAQAHPLPTTPTSLVNLIWTGR